MRDKQDRGAKLVLKAGEQLNLSYAVAVWDGETSAQQIESLYEKWSTAR